MGVFMGVTAVCAGVPVGVTPVLAAILPLAPPDTMGVPAAAAAVDDCASPRRTLRSGWYWLGVMSPRARRSSSCLVCSKEKRE